MKQKALGQLENDMEKLEQGPVMHAARVPLRSLLLAGRLASGCCECWCTTGDPQLPFSPSDGGTYSQRNCSGGHTAFAVPPEAAGLLV